MKVKMIKMIALVLSLTAIMGVMAVTVSAASSESKSLAPMNTGMDPEDGRVYKYLKSVSNKNIQSYNKISAYINKHALSVKGVIINGVSYIPFRAAASAISGSKYSYNSSTRTSVMTAPGLEIIAGDGCYVTYANGRTLFNTTPNVIMSDGRLYIPASVYAKAVGMSLSESGNISLNGNYNPILHADKFYQSDEVFWLGRIIHAESRGESLLGQIAVGNVVLNRVKSAYYPNTIYGVIFDRKYGVQFSPVLDGSIYNTPNYNATLAAKICLEGYDITGGAFFFLEPRLATSSWIPRTREYAFTIGNHDFYY